MTEASPPDDAPRRAHLLVRPGVELLDFAGPGQVLATAGYTVEAVAVRPGPVTSQGFLQIEPTGILGEGPPPEILVVPGGSSEAGLADEALIEALRRTEVPVVFSVCTGALLLAAAGRLSGLEVTTWHGALDRLRALAPDARVLGDVRYTDNLLPPPPGSEGEGGAGPTGTRRVVTSAGVSAGIDAAFHLVEAQKGPEHARMVARYMEYPYPPVSAAEARS